MVANPDAVKINIDGKVIVPIPALLRAVAKGSFTYDPSQATKTGKFYSGAFQQLLGSMLNLTFVESWDNPITKRNRAKVDTICKAYAILDGPESYHFEYVKSDVNFVLSSDEDKFHRPVYYSAFTNIGNTSMLFVNSADLMYYGMQAVGDIGTSHMLYSQAKIKDVDSNFEAKELDKAIASTILSTDAFVAKFGFRLVNDVQQSLNDAIVNDLRKRSK